MIKNLPTPRILQLLFSFLLLFLFQTNGFGQTTATFNNSGKFTVPAGITSITVQAWGAGQDGVSAWWWVTGGGGGGGAYAESTFNVTPGNSYTIVVGSSGSVGGNSSVALSPSASPLIVKAEGGGQSGDYLGGQASNSNGTIKYNGGNGYSSNSIYGGGGGSAGNNGNGNNASDSNGGSGGAGISGDGGDFDRDGKNPGGGGGEKNSGNGGNGQVIITWSCTVGGSITANASSVCSGINSTTLTLSGNTGSVSKWQSSVSPFTTWTDILNTSTSLTVTNLTVTKSYRAVVQNGSCPSVNSTSAILTVSPTSVGGSITPNASSVCSGTNSTLLNLSGNTGSVVKWQSSVSPFTTWTDISNTTTSFTATNLTATTQFRAVVQSGICSLAYSAIATVTVSPAITPGNVTGGTTICSGNTSEILTLSGNTGTVIKWQSSVSPFTTWIDISNTATTYTSGVLSATTQFRAVVQSGGCTISSSASTVTVTSTTVGGSLAGGTTICSATNSTTLTLSGQTGNVIRWESSLDNFLSIGTVIANTTTSLIAINLNTTTYYRAVVQSASCGSIVNSAIATIISQPSVGGTVSSGQNICSGSIPNDLILSGNTGNVTKWQKSSSSTFASGNTDITSTSTTLTSGIIGALTSTTYFRAVIQNGSCSIAYSASIAITVNALPTQPTSVKPNNTTYSCNGSSIDLNATSVGNTIYWYTTSTGGTPIGSSASGANFSVTPTSSTSYYAEAQSPSGCVNTTRIQTSTINILDPGTIEGSSVSCYTNFNPPKIQSQLDASGGSNSSTYTYQWQSSTDNVNFTNINDKGDNSDYNPPKGTNYTTYYRRIVTIGSSCEAISNTIIVTIGAETPHPSVSTQPTCSQPNGTITITDYNPAYVYSTTPSTGVTISGNTVTAPAGNYILQATLSYTSGKGKKNDPFVFNSCTSGNSNTVVINTQPATPAKPSASPTSSCVNLGTITINPVISGMNYSIDGLTYTNTSGVFTSLALGGTYNVTARNSSGCTSPATTVLISPLVTKTWDGYKWTIAPSTTSVAAPSSDNPIIFAANYTSSGDLSACSCLVNTGANVVFKPTHTLTIVNEVKVKNESIDPTPKATLTFEDTASLVQTNNVSNTNSGDIIYNRTTNTLVRNTDYTYWSTPVSPLKLAGGTGGILYSATALTGSIFYSYLVTSTTEDWKSETASTLMEAGKGYSIRGPGSISAAPLGQLGVIFTGVPNNGHYQIPIAKANASYLLGNPYPSAINANQFLSDNASVLDGTLYFWTHNTLIGNSTSNVGTGALPYTQDDYASYNLTGGVGTDAYGNPKGANAASSGGQKPNGTIGAGQGFFATSILASGNIVFNNSMRLILNAAPIANTQFFKTKNTNSKTVNAVNAVEKNRVWLNLTNTEGAFKQTLIGYVTGATNEIDSAFDGESFDGQEFIDFYSVNQDKNLTIQGRALPFDENDIVPLGFRSTIDGPFTINIDQVDGSMTNQAVFIEDKLTNTITDLKSSNYTFSTASGTFNDRFVLRYTNGKTLNTNTVIAQENQVLVSYKNKQITINSFSETVDKVLIYDLAGKQLYQKTNVNSNEFTILNLAISHQVLVVKTILQNGQAISNKIIF